jgi:hypothetical protein
MFPKEIFNIICPVKYFPADTVKRDFSRRAVRERIIAFKKRKKEYKYKILRESRQINDSEKQALILLKSMWIFQTYGWILSKYKCTGGNCRCTIAEYRYTEIKVL